MQTTCGVDQHHVCTVCLCRFERIEGHRSGIRAHLLANHRRSGTLGPHAQLVDCSRTEGIRCADIDLLTRLAKLCSELADGGGFACAIDAHDHHNIGLALLCVEPESRVVAVILFEQQSDFVAQNRLKLSGIHILVARHTLLDTTNDFYGCFDAHVRGDQDLLQLIEHIVIDLRATRHGACQLAEQTLLGLFESCIKFFALGGCGFGCRGLLFGLFLLEKIE